MQRLIKRLSSKPGGGVPTGDATPAVASNGTALPQLQPQIPQPQAANDEQQSEVMDLNHHNLTIALGDQLYIAPLERDKIKKVLDVGTGTGIWAIDFADEFPDAEIIGTDISPIQPSWVPPNLQFEIEDCSQEWTFGAETFDFIHMRWLVGGIADWYDLFAQAYRAMKPGGWVQSLETSPHLTSDDGSVTGTTAMGQWGKFFIEGGKKLGRPFTIVDEGVQRKAMEAAGFVDIQEYDFKMPLGSWPKDPRLKQMGQFAEIVLDKDIEGWVLFMANTLGWSREEILVYVGMLRKELRSGALHAYYSQKVVWARKPEF
ncbi:Demethylmenaquinone methyltransferase [Escovopsis weberi]|uniref:Demethylmenaquinone methyltransferase n=1 Tax=Escovopsis weberi TaxID=150374 RepID=A0A0M8N110_ESCWE|nr:Demethylmenaquinone methyltransferase [Escovopsis weberi]